MRTKSGMNTQAMIKETAKSAVDPPFPAATRAGTRKTSSARRIIVDGGGKC